MKMASNGRPNGYSGVFATVVVVVAKTVTVTVTTGAGSMVRGEVPWLGLLFESPGYEAVTEPPPGGVPVTWTVQVAPDRVQVVGEKYRLPELDHEIVSPVIVPNVPETVAVQELVEPTSIVAGEQRTDVLVVDGARTVTELSATWAGEVNDISTQCVPSPKLLAEKVTAATLPELSDETN